MVNDDNSNDVPNIEALDAIKQWMGFVSHSLGVDMNYDVMTFDKNKGVYIVLDIQGKKYKLTVEEIKEPEAIEPR